MYFSLIKPGAGRERDAAHEWASGPCSEDFQWLWRLFPARRMEARARLPVSPTGC